MEEQITISKKRYDELVDAEQQLMSLEAGGVDNWEWYYESLADYRAWKGEED